MDSLGFSLQFLVQLAQVLAWPAVALVVVVLLRKPLSSLLPELSSFRWKDLEIEFERKIGKIVEQADGVLPPPERAEATRAAIKGPGAQTDRFTALAELSPSAAILDTWLDVEAAVRQAASRHAMTQDQEVPPLQAIQALAKEGVLDPQTLAILDGLRHLKNIAAHAPANAITVSQARELREIALRLAAKIKSL